MHGMMKRIIQAIEAIPLHLTLNIVRFDDSKGASWPLPYEASRTRAVSSFPTSSEPLTYSLPKVVP